MDKKTDLYFIQNMMIFMEECMVKEPVLNDCFTINPFYVKDTVTFSALKQDIQTIYPFIQYIEFSDCGNIRFDTIYMSSYIQEEHMHTVTDLNFERIILVEDGLFDYISDTDKYPFYYGKDLYLFRPEIASSEAVRAVLHPLNPARNITNKFAALYQEALNNFSRLKKDTPILFTTPLSEDFNADSALPDTILDYIKKELSFNRIILKKHPRDHFTYQSDSIDIIECPQNIPGQFLDEMFDGKKVFLFPSTVSFMCGELSDIIFLNVLPQNPKYSSAFEKVLASKIFFSQKSIIYRSF